LLKNGTFVIYLSSDKVFDGTIQHVAPDAAYSPVTEYGRQKLRAEMNLLNHDRTAILRLSKVLGGENLLFAGWMESLRRGEIIRPFSDMFLAPIPVRSVISTIQLIGMAKAGGIWQLSGQEDVSYAEVGLHAARILGVDEALGLGIVNQVIQDEEPSGDGFWKSIMDIARSFCPPAKASRAVGHIKRAVQTGGELTLEAGLALERELQQRLFTSADAREGIGAFTGKRKPEFTGG